MTSPRPKHPKVFISYSHDSSEHVDRVLDLSNRLRSDGIDCHIDQYETSPPEGWPRWMINQVREADFVLVVCTEKYERRFSGGSEEVGKGLGAKWEGAVITQELYEGEANNTKFIPVVFSADHLRHVPILLRGATHYQVTTQEGYEHLYRRLSDQPRVQKPKLGTLRAMPPLKRKQDFLAAPLSPDSSRVQTTFTPFFSGGPPRVNLSRIEEAVRESMLRILATYSGQAVIFPHPLQGGISNKTAKEISYQIDLRGPSDAYCKDSLIFRSDGSFQSVQIYRWQQGREIWFDLFAMVFQLVHCFFFIHRWLPKFCEKTKYQSISGLVEVSASIPKGTALVDTSHLADTGMQVARFSSDTEEAGGEVAVFPMIGSNVSCDISEPVTELLNFIVNGFEFSVFGRRGLAKINDKSLKAFIQGALSKIEQRQRA